MKRRTFIAGTLLLPSAARAQSSRPHRIAIVHPAFPVEQMTENGSAWFRRLFSAFRAVGYMEGVNLTIDRFSAKGQTENFAQIADRVVRSNPDLICANSSRMVRALKSATPTIPMVVWMADPIAYGLISSLARPGGNITGVVSESGLGTWAKRLELLQNIVPAATKFGLLATVGVRDDVQGRYIREQAARLSIELLPHALEPPLSERSYGELFERFEADDAHGLVVTMQPEHLVFQDTIVRLASQSRIPVMHPYRDHVDHGGLMAYSFDDADLHSQLAVRVDRVLKGDDPGTIPFYLPTWHRLLINLKAASSMGLVVPGLLLARADEIIQ